MKIFTSFFPDLKNFTIPSGTVLNPQKKNIASFFAVITAVFVLNNIVWLTPTFGSVYYAVLIAILFLLLLQTGKFTLRIEMIFLYLACICSIYLNDIPSFFKAEYRLISFILITLLVSPAISSEFLAYYRINLFRNILLGIIFLVILSFFSRFLGFSKMQGSYWCGIVNHSMTLGPLAGIALLTIISDWIIYGKEYSFQKKICLLFSISCAMSCMLGASSRAAIIATLMGAILLINVYFNFSQVVKWGTMFLILSLISLPLWQPLWQNVIAKNQNSETISFSSREEIWQERIREFQENPFWGCGFSSVDVDSALYSYDIDSGKVEPGSSWLCILSMTGICGFLAFLLLQYNTFARFVQLTNRKQMILLVAILIFWYFEFCAQGFVFAAGSFEFFFLWLLFGCIEALNVLQNINSNKKQNNHRGSF